MIDWIVRVGLGALGCAVAVAAQPTPEAEMMPPRLYDVTTEMGMPHLEENLRYATTREARCLAGADLATAFPVLRHVALSDCRLADGSRQAENLRYVLRCDGGHGTTGDAVWRITDSLVTGTLTVTLGGKNMTFYQRVTARPLGDCAAGAE